MKPSTQQFVAVSDIKNDLVLLKNGDYALVIQSSAVNFGLLSEGEQIAIIGAFAGMLNSLSFSIQILIRSKRLNISSYLQKLDIYRNRQTNPLLADMMVRYRNFVEKTIKENEVLDKQFFVILPLSSLEVGLFANPEERIKKALSTITPRRDHIIRQLTRIGLQAKQLTDKELVKLFFDFYNESAEQGDFVYLEQASQKVIQNALPENKVTPKAPPQTIRPVTSYTNSPSLQSVVSPNQRLIHPSTPFIVEELKDEYGVI